MWHADWSASPWLVVTLLLWPSLGFVLCAQPFASIPDSLKQGADMVVISEQIRISIRDHQQYIHDVQDTRMIMRSGEHHLTEIFWYDDHAKIKELSISYYDADGHVIEELGRRDFEDISASEGSMISDTRLLVHTYTPVAFPLYVKRNYQIIRENTAFLPSWCTWDSHTSVISSQWTITCPPDLGLRMLETNLASAGITKTGDGESITYEVSHLSSSLRTRLSTAGISPVVRGALTTFSLAGVAGRASTWAEFGRWYYQHFIEGRQELPYQIPKLDAELASCDSDVCRVKKIYDYVQERTRYISIQLGIGGWLPMTAMDVHTLGYGDCKGLSNYTMALLQRAQIPAYYTILYAGAETQNIHKTFAGLAGNHVILCLPDPAHPSDTLWLECTAKFNPVGHLGSFADSRQVLVVSEEGGHIRRTRSYGATANEITTAVLYHGYQTARLQSDGDKAPLASTISQTVLGGRPTIRNNG